MPSGVAEAALPYLRRITVDEYHRMIDAGVFPDGSRVELVEGTLIEMPPPHGPLHVSAMDALDVYFSRVDRSRWAVVCQGPLTLGDFGEPEPDWSIVARADFLAGAKPRTAALVVEVSDTSLARDRSVKLPTYAAHALPEVWILDVRARTVTVHRAPLPAERRYADVRTLAGDDALCPAALPELTTRVSDLLR